MYWKIKKKPHNCDGHADAEACGYLHRMDLQCERAPKTLKNAAKYVGEPFPALAERDSAATQGCSSQQWPHLRARPRWEAIPCPNLQTKHRRETRKGKQIAWDFPAASPGLESEQSRAAVRAG